MRSFRAFTSRLRRFGSRRGDEAGTGAAGVRAVTAGLGSDWRWGQAAGGASAPAPGCGDLQNLNTGEEPATFWLSVKLLLEPSRK